MKRHQPKHIYANNQIYFITSHINDREFLLDTDFKKDKLLLKIVSFSWEDGIELRAWVILNSYWNYLRLNGNEWLMNVMETYPIVDFIVENDK